MDSYRGNLVQHESGNSSLPDDRFELREEAAFGHDAEPGIDLGGEDDIGRQLPPASVGQNERRMQVRAYNYWASLLGNRPFPRIADVMAADVPDFADYAVVLDFSKAISNPAVTMLGKKLAEECGTATSIERLSDVSGQSLLSRITDHCRQILAIAAPIGFEAEFINQRGKTLLYRSILLPFSSDGKNIHHILGVINWKELADPLITAELLQQLEIAVGTTPAPLPRQKLGVWADGPTAVEPGKPDATVPLTCEPVMRELADWLAVARKSAADAAGLEQRSRAALYAAIGGAWDFVLAAEAQPVAWREAIAAAGLPVAAQAPLAGVVELVFGDKHDKAGLAQIATVLAHARRRDLERGAVAGFLAAMPGGLKRVVGEEIALRRTEDRRSTRM